MTPFSIWFGVPDTGQQRVLSEVPQKIIAEILGTTVHFPFAQHIKAEVIQQEDTARTISARRAKGTDVDAIGSAVNSMRA
jgi:hypothetical protein